MSVLANRRILFFVSEFPPQPGGIGNHAWNLARELHRQGACVRLIAEGRRHGGILEPAFDAAAPFTILRIPFSVAGVRQLRRVLLYLRTLNAWKPDVVVASGRFPLLLVARVPTRAAKVAVLHGTEAGTQGSATRKQVLAALRRFTGLIAVSRFTRTHFELDPRDPRVSVIPNGVANDRFAGCANKVEGVRFAGFPCLATVGNVTRRKGQDNVIRALPLLLQRYPEAVFHMAGIPTEREAFTTLARRLGVDRHIEFHGAVSDGVLHALLQATDVFLMLSAATESGDVEGFGIAILEANLLGVPAVGSTGCGIEDAIVNGRTGILVDPSDVQAVACAIESVLLAREDYSPQAQEWVGQHTWQAIGERYARAIGEALAVRGHS